MSAETKKELPKNGWDGKPVFERDEVLTLPIKYSNKMTVMFHEEVARGEHEGAEFRLIRDIGNRAMRLSWRGQQLDIDTRQLIAGLMTKLELLQKVEKVHKKRKVAANGKG